MESISSLNGANQSIQQNNKNEPVEKKEPQKVSIFSKYDDTQNNVVAYKEDASAKSYIDSGKKINVASNIADNVKTLLNGKININTMWNNVVGAFSNGYVTQRVDADKADSAKAKIDASMESSMQNQISNANQMIQQAYNDALKEVQAEIKKAGNDEENQTNKTVDDKSNTQTLEDLQNSGTKYKTKTRRVNGKEQEYIIYKDSNGEKHRALVKEDGTLDELVEHGSTKGTLMQKEFISKSYVQNSLGLDKLPNGVFLETYDKEHPENSTFSVLIGGEYKTFDVQQTKTYIALHRNQSEFVTSSSEQKYENPSTISELQANGTKYDIKTRTVNGQDQEYIIYKDSQGTTHRAKLTREGKLDELVEHGSTKGTLMQKDFISKSFIQNSLGLDKLPKGVMMETYDKENPANSTFSVQIGGEYKTLNAPQLKQYLKTHNL